MKLQKGDVFASSNPQGIGRPIRWIERFWAKDRAAQYGHTGIIQDEAGTTLEALMTITEGNLFEQYHGQRVIIARPKTMAVRVERSLISLKAVHLGQIYPAWRLPLFILQPLARRVSWRGKYVVCSELVAKYLRQIGVRPYPYQGTNPDELVDEWRRWRDFEIIFEGVLPATAADFGKLRQTHAK